MIVCIKFYCLYNRSNDNYTAYYFEGNAKFLTPKQKPLIHLWEFSNSPEFGKVSSLLKKGSESHLLSFHLKESIGSIKALRFGIICLLWDLFPSLHALLQVSLFPVHISTHLFNHEPNSSCEMNISRSVGDCGLPDCILPPWTCYLWAFAPIYLPCSVGTILHGGHRFYCFGTDSSLVVLSKEEWSGFNQSVVIVVKKNSNFLSHLLSVCKYVQNLLLAFDLMHFAFLLNATMM